MNRLPQILICDDDSLLHLGVKHALKGHCECRSAYNTDEALLILKKQPADVLLLDIQIRTPLEGLEAIAKFRETDADMAIVMLSGVVDYQVVRDAMKLGARDYISKDFEKGDLLHSITRVLEHRRLLQQRQRQNYELAAEQQKQVLVGENSSVQALRRTIERIRQSPANVVITGETGTGKEVIARLLRGTLPDGTLAPFISVDSSTIQSSTAESLLFGHEKGAFTGADRTTKGLFEEAHGGIIYFDEIANMSPEVQVKLLRVLQEKEVTRLGSSRVMQLDFRVVCATNRNLEEMVEKGLFKDDLLQRISVLPIHIPPLRERNDDIPLLVAHFLRKTGEKGLSFSPEALHALKTYKWPGNVRELGNMVAYVTAMIDGTTVELADLPPKFRDTICSDAPGLPNTAARATSFYARVAQYEETILREEYHRADGNVSRLALSLAMDRSHLYTKLREYGIHDKRETSKTR
ncbi:MAG: hypothetical protein A2X94_05395 [Bdellovibrionales bacterium GWB1_55_8]|nr:MAG: hypothetical protein A2X94_05395 [Bdellovibrionales bacterium GWB1_55_8]